MMRNGGYSLSPLLYEPPCIYHMLLYPPSPPPPSVLLSSLHSWAIFRLVAWVILLIRVSVQVRMCIQYVMYLHV